MRTKNVKRLWPVPATLGLVALAALLAFGLMAANGAQPAAAQGTPDCNVSNVGTATAAQTPTADTPVISATIACGTKNSPALVRVTGNLGEETVDEATVWVYAKNGDIAGGTTLTDIWDHTATAAAAPNAPAATRFSAIKFDIPEAEGPGVGGGAAKRQKHDLMVTPAAGKNVVTLYVYFQDGRPVPTAAFDHDSNGANTSPPVKKIDAPTASGTGPSGTVTLTFLGPPAVGKDGADYNKKIDDDILEQCRLTSDTTRQRLVGEATPAADGSARTCAEIDDGDLTAGDWAPITPNPDMAETRSKVISYTPAGTSTETDPEVVKDVFDGKSMEHALGPNQTMATIYVRVEDAHGSGLQGTDVTFTTTVVPSDLQVDLRATHTEDALRVVDEGDVVAGNSITISDTIRTATGLQEVSEGGDATIPGDVVAIRPITRLPTDEPFRITVDVTAGGVDLGSVVISRAGEPDVFNAACLDNVPDAVNGDIDYSGVNVDLTNKNCDDSGMARRFGAGDAIVVKAHVEDALGAMQDDGDLSIELADDFDDPLSLTSPTAITTPVTGQDGVEAWVYVVDDDAMLGDHMITVSTGLKGKDDDDEEVDIDDVPLTVTIAGPPASYEIEGPMYVALHESAEFTVTAKDENGGAPHFTTDASKMVDVFIQGLAPGNTRGLSTAGKLELDDDGMGSFTIYVPNDATEGATYRIFYGTGDMEETHTVTVGSEPTVPDMPTNVMAEADSDTQITVSWYAPADNGGRAITGYIIERRHGDMMAITSDGYAHPMHAFDGHMDWWESLNCTGMLQAAGSDDNEKYCQHYDMTAPSNIAGTIMADSELDMEIKALFDARYVTVGNVTSHEDMDLTQMTEYTYRVSAVNSVGRSAWSAAAMATTDPESTELTMPTNVVATVDGSDVEVTWTDGMNAVTHMVILFAYPSFDIGDDHIATNQDSGDTRFRAVASGEYLAVVVSINADGDYRYAHKMVSVGQ